MSAMAPRRHGRLAKDERVFAILLLAPALVVLFATTPMSVPTGERGKLLQRIHVQLAKLNNAELARAVKMLKALE